MFLCVSSVFSEWLSLAHSIGLRELVTTESWQHERLIAILHMMVLEELTQSFLRLRASRFPEVFSGNGSVLVLREVGDHFGHVSIGTNADKELLKHLG